MKHDDIKEAILTAKEAAEEYAKNFGSVDNIPKEDLEILKKYLGNKLPKCLGHRKPSISKDIYYPSLTDDRFYGVPMIIWFKLVKSAMDMYEIENSFSLASARSYLSAPWRYLDDPDKMTVFPHSEFSQKELKEWQEVLEEVKNENN